MITARTQPYSGVWTLRRTPAGAVAFVKGTMDGLAASAKLDSASGMWIPVAELRSDQEFLRERLEERGIKCVLSKDTRRHVSDMMVAAGVDVLLAELQSYSDPADIVRRVYGAMESKR